MRYMLSAKYYEYGRVQPDEAESTPLLSLSQPAPHASNWPMGFAEAVICKGYQIGHDLCAALTESGRLQWTRIFVRQRRLRDDAGGFIEGFQRHKTGPNAPAYASRGNT